MHYGAEIFINSDSSLAAVKTLHLPPPSSPPRARASRRGKVRGMSSRSARRLRRLLSFVKYTRDMSFLTLTYRDAVDIAKVKRDIHVLTIRLRRKFLRCWGIWKIELQQRGVWHIHVLLVNVPFWHWRDIVKVWSEVSGQDAQRATNIKHVKSLRQLRAYLAKYIAKSTFNVDAETGELLENTGRVWGVFNRAVAVFLVDVAYCTMREYYALKRVTRRLRYDAQYFDFFIYRASFIRQLFEYMHIDIETLEMKYSQIVNIIY